MLNRPTNLIEAGQGKNKKSTKNIKFEHSIFNL